MATQPISADFPYEPNFVEVHGSQIHFVEEGRGDPILFLHGNPTSSYLWRNVMPHVHAHARCIAMDLIGMGKSDKPDIDYSFFDHSKYVEGFIETLGLQNLTLVIHDWGSALGFHYAMRNEANIKALAFMEAILMPIPSWDAMPPDLKETFQAFRTPEVGWDMIVNQHMFVEQILPSLVVRELTDAEMDHYRAPYLDPPSRKPLWRWPNEVPIAGEPAAVVAMVEEYHRKLQQSRLPKLLLSATPGGIIDAQAVAWCQQNLPNLQVVDIGPGIHFVQEDNPHLIGTALAKWYTHLSA